jgi:DNA mismatch repair endonuclease MutH
MTKFSSVKELQSFYNKFVNKTLGEVYDYILVYYPDILLKDNKGIAGHVLEGIIGNKPNSNPNPDVESIGVELKAMPVRRIGSKIQPKERSKIKSINYNKIVLESWSDSELKLKIDKILFLIYEHPTGKTYLDWREFYFKGTLLFELFRNNEYVIKNDWEKIKSKVLINKADSLSESDGEILGACTSGTSKLIKYGNDSLAKQRSYSFKHSYVKLYYAENKGGVKFSSINLPSNVEIQDYLVEVINNKIKGKSISDLLIEYELDFNDFSKSSFSKLLNKILNIESKTKILELELKGIKIKTIPVNHNGIPWEAMSFPKFSLVDLFEEDWDIDLDENVTNESVFKSLISNGFIFVTLIKEKNLKFKNDEDEQKIKYNHWTEWIIGDVFYWKPDEIDMGLIRQDWLEAKDTVVKGVKVTQKKTLKRVYQVNNLLKSSESRAIHIRPHAQNSKHIDMPYYEFTKNEIRISWQSFWFNKRFIQELIKKHI